MHLQSNQIFELNPTGARLWELIAEGLELGEVRRRLGEEFDSNGADISRDIDELLEALLTEDLVAIAPEASSSIAVAPEVAEPSRSEVPFGSWVLRLKSGEGGAAPRVLGRGRSLETCELGSGARVVVDGYLLDDDPARPAVRSPGSSARWVGAAYEQSGDAFLTELRGGFAAAVWDRRRGRLIAGRDGTGLRPCFYFWNGSQFLLSTSVDALLSQPEVTARLNRPLLSEYLQDGLRGGDDRSRETLYEGIHRLLPGERLVLERGKLLLDRSWDPLPPGFAWANEEEACTLPALLERAVARCMSVGADCLALSGGFDSVSLAILAAGLSPERRLHALSMSFSGDATCDETATERAVARELGMPQTFEAMPSAPVASDFVDRALSNSDLLPSPVLSLWQTPFSQLLRKGSELGLQRLLLGTGGDEVLGVDPAHARDLLGLADVGSLFEFQGAWRRTESLGLVRSQLWSSVFRPPLLQFSRRLLGPVEPHLRRSWRAARRSPPALAIGDAELAREVARRREAGSTAGPAGEGAYVREMRELLRAPQLLLGLDQGDRLMEPFGVTPLYPFFDRDVVALALRIPPAELYAGGVLKRPLRDLVARRLPAVTMPTRKIDFTERARAVLRGAGRATFQALGGIPRLAELGILDARSTHALMEGFFEGRHQSWLPVWLVLSTEAWVQSRAPVERRLRGAA